MAYRNTLQADALKLVAKKLQSSLAVEGELPEDGLAAYGDDGDDLMMALARKIVSGDEEDGETVEEVFAQARDAEASAEELLVDDGWKVGGGRAGGRRGQRQRPTGRQHHATASTSSGRRSSWPGGQRRTPTGTATRPTVNGQRPTATTSPGAAAVAVLLGRVHGRGAGQAEGPQAASPSPRPSRCSSGR